MNAALNLEPSTKRGLTDHWCVSVRERERERAIVLPNLLLPPSLFAADGFIARDYNANGHFLPSQSIIVVKP